MTSDSRFRARVYVWVSVVTFLSVVFDFAHAKAEPTPEEIFFVELLNRARANPMAEAALYGIDLNEGVPAGDVITGEAKPPLAINAGLVSAAQKHSADMATRGYFSHYTLGTNASPAARCLAEGYHLWSGENIAMSASTRSLTVDQSTAAYHHEILFVDEGYSGRGHRLNLMNEAHFEVGVGMAEGIFIDGSGQTWPSAVLSTIDFGRKGGSLFLCGVIYDDKNANDFYDVGEGMRGAVVTLEGTGTQVAAWSGGAYSMPVPGAGTYTLSVSFPESGDVASKTVSVGSENVKVDFLSSDFTLAPTSPPVIRSFAADPVSGDAPLEVTLTADAFDPDGSALQWQWDLGDGVIVHGEGPVTHTYDDPGDYTVTLRVTDANGFPAQDTLVVSVNSPPPPVPPPTQDPEPPANEDPDPPPPVNPTLPAGSPPAYTPPAPPSPPTAPEVQQKEDPEPPKASPLPQTDPCGTVSGSVGACAGNSTFEVDGEDTVELTVNTTNGAGDEPAREWLVFMGVVGETTTPIYLLTAEGVEEFVPGKDLRAATYPFTHTGDAFMLGSVRMRDLGFSSGDRLIYAYAYENRVGDIIVENVVVLDIR
jgi:PKD repeat protein